MNEENNFGGGLPEGIDYIPQTPVNQGVQNVTAPVLDDFDYSAPQPKNDGPQGVAAPVLDDFDYYTPSEKRDGPQGVAAPVLDDMDSYSPSSEKRGAPQVAAPILDDGSSYSSSAPQQNVLSDEDIIAGLTPELKQQFDMLPPDKQQQVIDMRRQQLGAVAPPPSVSAAILDEDNYTPPPKQENAHPAQPVQAAILDDEPDLPKPQVSSYEQQELERIKAEAAKKAVSSSLVSEQKDEKESLRMMLELKEEQRREQAAKGFKITIVLAVIGFVAAIAFYILYTGKLGMPYANTIEGKGRFLENTSVYIMIAMALSALGLISGMKPVKTLTSLIYLVVGILQIFPGLAMIPQHSGSLVKVVLFYVIAFGGTLAVFFTISASECVGQYFSKHSEM